MVFGLPSSEGTLSLGGLGVAAVELWGQGQDTIIFLLLTAFLVIALIAAVFGFGGVASASAGIAQILFFIFLVLFIAAIIMRVVRKV